MSIEEAFKIQKKLFRGSKRYFFHNGQLPFKTETFVFMRVSFDGPLNNSNINSVSYRNND